MSASPAPLPAPPPPTCGNCVYAYTNRVRFVCRRHPPSARSTGSDVGVVDVFEWWWCGEWRQMTGGMPNGDIPA